MVSETSTVCRQVSRQAVGLGSHDEVVAVQAANLVGPPRDGDATPLRKESGVMSFLLRESADLVCQIERLREVFETKRALQPGDAFAGDDLPFGDLLFQFGDFLVRHTWRVGATCRAF